MGSKFGMDTVRADDDISLGRSAVGERQPHHIIPLFHASPAMIGVHDIAGQGAGENLNEVGAVHSKCRVPAGGIGYLNRSDGRSIVAKIAGMGAYARSRRLHRWPQSNPDKVTYAVRSQKHAGAHLADNRSL